jgi:CRISPR-associated endonuclease/helicase Cas3
LDLPGFDQLDFEDIEEWFDTHSIRTHESLSVPTSAAATWFKARWARLTDAEKHAIGVRSIVIDRAGMKLVTVKELIEQLDRKHLDSVRSADLILPASFGGIERGVGLLDPSAPKNPEEAADSNETQREAIAETRHASPDVADERGRYREFVTRPEEGEVERCPIGSGQKPVKLASHARFTINLESGDDTRIRLTSYVPKPEQLEWGSKKQSLSEHVGLVRAKLTEILRRLDLPEPLQCAALLAADFHDHGKNRARWQDAAGGVVTPPGEKWSKQTIGKSGGAMNRDRRHYRHEFGSLREFIDAHGATTSADLALHLIAAHHGRGRPHFPQGGFDPDAESRSESIHADVIRRFARLQRKYGRWYLAWLENLLRCADALASVDANSGDRPEADDSNGGDA